MRAGRQARATCCGQAGRQERLAAGGQAGSSGLLRAGRQEQLAAGCQEQVEPRSCMVQDAVATSHAAALPAACHAPLRGRTDSPFIAHSLKPAARVCAAGAGTFGKTGGGRMGAAGSGTSQRVALLAAAAAAGRVQQAQGARQQAQGGQQRGLAAGGAPVSPPASTSERYISTVAHLQQARAEAATEATLPVRVAVAAGWHRAAVSTGQG